MSLPKHYQPSEVEPDLEARWQAEGLYHFEDGDPRPVFTIDTPPATVSGHLHIGHVYSYSHADFMARFFRMRGYNVFYPMGFDDNGLPTERYVEKLLGIEAREMDRQAFIEKCLEVSETEEAQYRTLWRRLGLSIDWRHTYRTIDANSRKTSQHSFIELYRKGLAYRAQAPMIWCPVCHTAIAQAELDDRERETEFVTLPFRTEAGDVTSGDVTSGNEALWIATTRPELLAACVAVFVHPEDARYRAWVGQKVRVPLYGRLVPVLSDPAADPEKGTGAVMCCTFGDQADVAWWYAHKLPLLEAIDENGRMLPVADFPGSEGQLAGLAVEEARRKIKDLLEAQGLILGHQPTTGTVRVHERCDTPVEYIVTRQWFIRVLENKSKFLELGQSIHWHPANMQARYQAWVENLNWDWCISRQRYFGVPFPVWYCKNCGEIMLANDEDLPIDPAAQAPRGACRCGSTEFIPETDVMDTWATSSLTPEIVTGWLDQPDQFARLFPMQMRPLAYEIIRTWVFSSIVKAWYHFGKLPWKDLLISGWAVAGQGMGKISKSKGGGGKPPLEILRQYSADAVRYWAASTSTGKNAIVSEEKMQMGQKLVTKLWNVARFAEPLIHDAPARIMDEQLTPADRWILSSLNDLILKATRSFEAYEYASAKAEIENFFWRDLADNYLEMAKQRLYDVQHPGHAGAQYALRQVLRTLLKLFAPLMPYVTDILWRELFAEEAGVTSIHKADWPVVDESFSPASLAYGELLIAIASAARRYKSEHALSLGAEFACLQIAAADPEMRRWLESARSDLTSVTRAHSVEVRERLEDGLLRLAVDAEGIEAAIQL